jgi:hypothetical protein
MSDSIGCAAARVTNLGKPGETWGQPACFYIPPRELSLPIATTLLSRWHAGGSFWISTYERDKSPADFARLIARIRDWYITFPLKALVSTGACITPTD